MIKQFLSTQCEQIQLLQYIFLLKFSNLNEALTPESYSRLLRAFLDSISDINDKISFLAIEQLNQLVTIILKWGAQATNKHEILSSIYFAGAVIEELSNTEHPIDTSTTNQIPCFKMALEYLRTRSQEKLPGPIRKIFFDYCIHFYDNDNKKPHPWTGELLSIAINLAKTTHDEVQIIQRITNISPTDVSYPQALKLALEILTKQGKNRIITENNPSPPYIQK